MKIWAIADLHLAKAVPDKNMGLFGQLWQDYMEKIEAHWRELIDPEDLILLPGDISWAMRLNEALIDLCWIDKLPGKKLLLRGNHDLWWTSNAKMSQALPSSIKFIHNTAFSWNGVAIGGSRLWDTEEYSFSQYIHFKENPKAKIQEVDKEENQKIFLRELQRLKISLEQMDKSARVKIAMTHYPPIGADLKPSITSQILETYNIDICVFGHLHSICRETQLFGVARGIQYYLVAADYIDFIPIKIWEGS